MNTTNLEIKKGQGLTQAWKAAGNTRALTPTEINQIFLDNRDMFGSNPNIIKKVGTLNVNIDTDCFTPATDFTEYKGFRNHSYEKYYRKYAGTPKCDNPTGPEPAPAPAPPGPTPGPINNAKWNITATTQAEKDLISQAAETSARLKTLFSNTAGLSKFQITLPTEKQIKQMIKEGKADNQNRKSILRQISNALTSMESCFTNLNTQYPQFLQGFTDKPIKFEFRYHLGNANMSYNPPTKTIKVGLQHSDEANGQSITRSIVHELGHNICQYKDWKYTQLEEIIVEIIASRLSGGNKSVAERIQEINQDTDYSKLPKGSIEKMNEFIAEYAKHGITFTEDEIKDITNWLNQK